MPSILDILGISGPTGPDQAAYGQPWRESFAPKTQAQRPWTPDLETDFQNWMGLQRLLYGYGQPDAPEQQYDYRAAWRAGAGPGTTQHWPSAFKLPGHPNRFVNINGQLMDTITMTPASLLDVLRAPTVPEGTYGVLR